MAQKLTETSTFTVDINGPTENDPASPASVNNPLQGLANRTNYLKQTTDGLQSDAAVKAARLDDVTNRVVKLETGTLTFSRTNAPVGLFNGKSMKTILAGVPIDIWYPEGGRMSTRFLVENNAAAALTSPTDLTEYRISLDTESMRVFTSATLTMTAIGNTSTPAVPVDVSAATNYAVAQSATALNSYNTAKAAYDAAVNTYNTQLTAYNAGSAKRTDYYNAYLYYKGLDDAYRATATYTFARAASSTQLSGPTQSTLHGAQYDRITDGVLGAGYFSYLSYFTGTDRSGTGVGKGIDPVSITSTGLATLQYMSFNDNSTSLTWYTNAKNHTLNIGAWVLNYNAYLTNSGNPPSTADRDSKQVTANAAYQTYLTTYNAAYNKYITDNPGSAAAAGGPITFLAGTGPTFLMYEVLGAGNPSVVASVQPTITTNSVVTMTITPSKSINPQAQYYLAVRPGFYTNKMIRTDIVSIVATYSE